LTVDDQRRRSVSVVAVDSKYAGHDVLNLAVRESILVGDAHSAQ
jgi:hypothetical protein